MNAPRRGRAELAVAVIAIALLAAFVRIFWHYDDVFSGGTVRLQGNDPWAHLRQVEYLVRHFPYRLGFDPYGAFPGGQDIPIAPLLDYLAAGTALLIHALVPLGVTTLAAVTHTVCAFAPPTIAAATTVVVYFTARSLYNRAVGLLAALSIAVAPGVHYANSVLGFFDHHVLEVLLSTLAFGALLRSFRSATELPLEQSTLLRSGLPPSIPPWKGGRPGMDRYTTTDPAAEGMNNERAPRSRRTVARSCVFGIVLALYLLTWIGGSFVVLIVAGWTVAQSVAEHLNGRDLRPLRQAVAPGVALAIVIMLPFRNEFPFAHHQLASLTATLAIAMGLPIISSVMRRRGWHHVYFLGFVTLAAVAAGVALYLLAPALFDRVLRGLNPRSAGSAEKTIGEVRSLFWTGGDATLGPAWSFFTTGFPLAMVGLMVVARRAWRFGRAADVMLLVWSGAVFVAMLGQMRFGYYAAVNVALLSAFVCFSAVEHARIVPDWLLRGGLPEDDARGGARSNERTDRARQHAARADHAPGGSSRGSRRLAFVLLVWLVGIAVAPPVYALSRVVGAYSGPSDAWMKALEWMRTETPEPLGDPAAYYALRGKRGAAEPFAYPDSAYGVMCWWDYGYWVTGIARRIPSANPTQRGATESARFYTATNEADAVALLRTVGARYVVVDRALPLLPVVGSTLTMGKFGALALWANAEPARFYETVMQTDQTGHARPITLYYPDYFRTMCVRLFLFGGARVAPPGPFRVASFTTVIDHAGVQHKRIEAIHTFDTYERASRFVARSTGGGVALMSDDPTHSCVPLEPLEHIRLVFDSVSSAPINGRNLGDVRVFAVDAPVDAAGPKDQPVDSG